MISSTGSSCFSSGGCPCFSRSNRGKGGPPPPPAPVYPGSEQAAKGNATQQAQAAAAAFEEKHPIRKILIATPGMIESAVTIEDVCYVLDCCGPSTCNDHSSLKAKMRYTRVTGGRPCTMKIPPEFDLKEDPPSNSGATSSGNKTSNIFASDPVAAAPDVDDPDRKPAALNLSNLRRIPLEGYREGDFKTTAASLPSHGMIFRLYSARSLYSESNTLTRIHDGDGLTNLRISLKPALQYTGGAFSAASAGINFGIDAMMLYAFLLRDLLFSTDVEQNSPAGGRGSDSNIATWLEGTNPEAQGD